MPLGRVMPIIVVYLLIRGTLGIIYDSEEVYFGIGISAKGPGCVGFADIGSYEAQRCWLRPALPRSTRS